MCRQATGFRDTIKNPQLDGMRLANVPVFFASFGAGVTDLDTLQGISYRPARFCLCEAHV